MSRYHINLFYSEEEAFIERLPEARKLVASRDPDDIPLAALALKLEIPIWSNDRDYRARGTMQSP